MGLLEDERFDCATAWDYIWDGSKDPSHSLFANREVNERNRNHQSDPGRRVSQVLR